ncbi:hypothetical protein ACNOYE_31520 [Nannocystaceae bacterium ST9]
MSQKALTTIFLLVLILGSLAFAFGPELLRARRRDALLRDGSDAIATIVRLDETGNVFNDQPEVRVTLVVQPSAGGEPYQTSLVQVLSAVELVNFQIGAEVAVKYDPSQPSEVALAGVPRPKPAPAPAKVP